MKKNQNLINLQLKKQNKIITNKKLTFIISYTHKLLRSQNNH